MPEKQTDRSCSFYDIQIAGQSLRLHAGRFAEWTEEKTLFIADVHLGKIEHFRRAGINLPGNAGEDTFYRLSGILQSCRPQRLIVLGDLFHSDFNDDFPRFAAWRKQFSETDVWLIPGNHDRTGRKYLSALGLQIMAPQRLGPFFLRHEPEVPDEGFLLCGHLHPSVSLAGRAREQIRIPAFWLQKRALCFPAFGVFTGMARINPQPDDVFFALSSSSVRRIPASLL